MNPDNEPGFRRSLSWAQVNVRMALRLAQTEFEKQQLELISTLLDRLDTFREAESAANEARVNLGDEVQSKVSKS